MDYFKRLADLLKIEKEEDRQSYREMIETMPVPVRREAGLTWYPIAIRDTEMTRGDYLTVELERTTHQEVIHQLRFGMNAALFSNHDPQGSRVEGLITHISGNKLKITLRTDELPDWSRDGKLGVDAIFDEVSYQEMEKALKTAPLLAEKRDEGKLVRVLTGNQQPAFVASHAAWTSPALNIEQQKAVQKILEAEDLAIVHGPPGTGKTTTLIQAIKALLKSDPSQILVVAPSNAAVDLLTEKLWDEGISVVRVGNPARVSEKLMSLTLDERISSHPSTKEIKKLKKQANEYRDLAHKYKRNFGKAERDQRKALFAEARNIMKEVEATEQYIAQNVLSNAQVITATLVGSNHYSVQHLRYNTVIIDEAGQSLEPACWIPILKGKKVVLAGDHCQLPPTIRSIEAARGGLAVTLLEKCAQLHPQSVTLLQQQYRMHELIMGYPSSVFYQNLLKADATVAQHLVAADEKPMAFIDTAGCGFDEVNEGFRISNPDEASFLLKHLTGLVKRIDDAHKEMSFPSIAVISPYKEQVEVLKDQLSSSHDLVKHQKNISVNTIDSFQGQERDIVYISLTRSNPDQNIGFLSDTRRMNVAMTRARKKLVMVGDSATITQLPFYNNLVAYAQDHDAYHSAWEFADIM